MMAAINPPKIRAELRITDPIFNILPGIPGYFTDLAANQNDEHRRRHNSGASLYKVRRPAARPSQPLKLQPVRVESQAALDNLSCTQRQPVIQSYFKLNIVNLL